MGQELNISQEFVRELRSPSEFTLRSQGKDFPVHQFSQDEAELLQKQLNKFIANLDSEVLTRLTMQRQDVIAKTAAFSKTQFDEKLFGGVNAADNEIGFSVLRPGQILEATGSSVVTDINDWYADSGGSTGWLDWIGDGGNNNKTVNEDDVILVLAFMDQSTTQTEISAVNVDEFGRNSNLLPIDVNDARLFDNEQDIQVVPIPSLIGQDNDAIHVRARWDRDVERQPRFFGFSFSLGSRLNTEDF